MTPKNEVEMEFRQIANSEVKLSRVALGGHEYLENGNSRGFNEDFVKATQSVYAAPGLASRIVLPVVGPSN